jgi:hypothetical protein
MGLSRDEREDFLTQDERLLLPDERSLAFRERCSRTMLKWGEDSAGNPAKDQTTTMQTVNPNDGGGVAGFLRDADLASCRGL